MESEKFKGEFSSDNQYAVLKLLADNCPLSVFIIDKNGDFLYVNRNSCESLGYTEEELLDFSVMKIDPWYDNSEWPHHWEEISKTVPEDFETRHRRKDGTVFPVQIITKRFNINGKEISIAFARDITVQNACNAQLTELENRLDIVFNASPDPIMILNDKGIVITVNASMCDILGYNLDEMAGKRIDEYLDKDSQQHFAKIFPAVLKDDDYNCEVVFLGKEGNLVRIQCSPKVITDENDEITSVMLFHKVI